MKLLYLVCFGITSLSVHAQKYTISGSVKDLGTGENLIGATIYNIPPLEGTTANNYGFFSITLTHDTVHLRISYVGYEQQTLKLFLSNDTTINIGLVEGSSLQEVVITGTKEDQIQESSRMGTIDVPIEQIKALPALMGEVDVLKVLQPSLLLLFACELVVDVDVPFEQSQLTLNTYFNPDSLWNAHVSLNRHVLDDGPYQVVDDARIIVYEEDIPVDTLINKGNGMYQSDTGKPTAGKRYKITADAAGYGSVSAESSLPSPVQIMSATFSEIESAHDQELRIRMKIKDPAEENYYQVLLEREQEYYDFNTETVRTVMDRAYLTSEDPTIQNENEEYDNDIIFNDLLFNGKEIDLTFNTSHYVVANFASTKLILKTLSGDYYNYVNTSSLQKNTTGDPFAQPVNVFNNIQNGFGIFAGYSTATFTKSIMRPVIFSISPVAAKPGDHIIITGENFINNPENHISVYFKGNPYVAYYGTVVQSSSNQLEVIIPANAVTGKIIISNGRVVISDTEFQIIN